MPTYNLKSNVYATVTIDGVTFGSPLVIDAGVKVRPLTIPRTAVDTGLTSSVENADATNMGSIYGSTGSSFYTQGLAGGMGVSLSLTGDHIENDFLIAGGAGGNSNGGGYGGYGGAGGVGLQLESTGTANASSNDGTIRGGTGGSSSGPYGSGAGGDGADVSGAVLKNDGAISGGAGGGGNFSAGGGTGVSLGTAATLDNAGSVSGGAGGAGYSGAQGGVGVNLAAGSTFNTLPTALTVSGGNGGAGFIGNSSTLGGGSGGTGGSGISVAAGASFTGAAATIRGGTGGSANYAGAGGAGITLNPGSALTNDGSIVGGTGGTGHSPADYIPLIGYFNSDGGAGRGGDGVDLTNATLTNLAGITGGTGGASAQGRYGGAGGVGVYLNGGQLYTGGAIQGGAGGVSAQTGAAGAGGYSVRFGPNPGTLHVEYGASFGGGIGGFSSGDVIDFANLNPSQTQGYTTQSIYYNSEKYNPLATPYSIITTSIDTPHDGSLTFEKVVSGAVLSYPSFNFIPDGTGGTDVTVACYVRGTRILTASGEVPIEALCIGQAVRTRDGLCKPIKWIGRRSYAGWFIAGNRDVLPVRICAGALADGVPHRDLYLSPLHALYLDDLLIPAIDLVNGASIVQLPRVDTVEYFHLELAAHDVIVAEGALAESYVDDGNRGMFHNAGDYRARYPAEMASSGAFCAPRISEGFALEAVRQRLIKRCESAPSLARHAGR